ncbi:MAG TPA: hypothetical protein VJS92_15830 [Candidatus Polarisedimenticolaceae bacterium]|nr:hypothetical protein [Candidatus Polarisedimenticolaceae bacterium]
MTRRPPDCRRARLALVERDLGSLPLTEEAVLNLHLRACPRCAAAALQLDRLGGELRRLATAAAPELDVTGRVLAHIRAEGPPPRSAITLGQWVGAAAATLVLASTAAVRLPAGIVAARPLLEVLSRLGQPAWAVIQALLATLAHATGAGLQILGSLRPTLEPLGLLALGAGYAVMAATITWIVGRDLGLFAFVRKERR